MNNQYIPQEVIRIKRDGGDLSRDQIEWIVRGISDGTLSDAQVGAWAMAIFFRGLSLSERVDLTKAMTYSGAVLDWSHLDRPAIDKHSTGGVGDKVSLILAPIVAACGGAVPMIAGRGLGHTGGTLDKLESIPGYTTKPSLDQLRQIIPRVGCAIVGQTAEIAPADRRLYAIRDATSTVESIPLIVASILSKKIAAGLDSLVLDVKVGSGAFMEQREHAVELAKALTSVANGNGLKCKALLTDMDQVLGKTAGNALEVRESIEILTGESADPGLLEVTLSLCATLLELSEIEGNLDDARTKAKQALDSGAAADVFAKMVHALGGPADIIENVDHYLPQAPEQLAVFPDEAGVIEQIDVRSVGIAILELGGGRRHEGDTIDPAVGISDVAGIGAEVGTDSPIAIVHARSTADAERVAQRILQAFKVGEHASLPKLLEQV